MSRVICVKVKNIRPKYKDLKEWCDDPNNLYIGRRGIVFIDGERYPKIDSPWANPYKIDKDNNREDVLKEYEEYIKNKINLTDLNLNDLKGKVLGCWCHPEKCHGDILIKLLNEHIYVIDYNKINQL